MADGRARSMDADPNADGPHSFPCTSWSLVAGLGAAEDGARRRALESLCGRYWKPVFHFVRRAWSKTPDDARDLTQGFFLRLLEGETLRRYAPARGSFRAYLKTVLRGFAADQHDALKALKRGGGAVILPLETETASLREQVADPRAPDPEAGFDADWRQAVLERGLERTRAWFEDTGRALQFRVFEACDLRPADAKPTYAALAGEFGVAESDVRNYLFSVRERLRTEIRAEIAHTVADPGELDAEWAALFGG